MNQFKRAKQKALDSGHQVENITDLQTAGVKTPVKEEANVKKEIQPDNIPTPIPTPVKVEESVVAEPAPVKVAPSVVPASAPVKTETAVVTEQTLIKSGTIPVKAEVPVIPEPTPIRAEEPAKTEPVPALTEIPVVEDTISVENIAPNAIPPIHTQVETPIVSIPESSYEETNLEPVIAIAPTASIPVPVRIAPAANVPEVTYVAPQQGAPMTTNTRPSSTKKNIPNIFAPKNEAKSMRKSLVLKPTSVKIAENYCAKNGGSFNELIQTLLDNFIDEYGL